MALHISNAVLDNCLSTLKHETMYYPSRIRQIVDLGDTNSLSEVVAYYRELYGILSMQAMKQTEHTKPAPAAIGSRYPGRPCAGGLSLRTAAQAGGPEEAAGQLPGQRPTNTSSAASPCRLQLTEQQAALFTRPPKVISLSALPADSARPWRGYQPPWLCHQGRSAGKGTRIVVTLPSRQNN